MLLLPLLPIAVFKCVKSPLIKVALRRCVGTGERKTGHFASNASAPRSSVSLRLYVQCINRIGRIQTTPAWRGRLEKQRKGVRRIKEERGLSTECGSKSQPVFQAMRACVRACVFVCC